VPRAASPDDGGVAILQGGPLRLAAALLVVVLAAPAACTSARDAGTGPSPASSPGTGPASTTPSPAARGRTFAGNGVSFSYPEGWRPLTLRDSSAAAGSPLWSRTLGLDGRNIVTVSAFALDTPITGANLESRSASIRAQLESLFAQAGGALVGGPTPQPMGGLPGLSFTGTAKTPNGEPVHSRLVLAFDGATEYFINCQYDERGREQIVSGCDLIVSTFTVRG
jgi:hypothetical protein